MLNQNIKLSIILPIYNEEKYISRALESILYQNVNFQYEIIIVDDHSSDKTVEIVQSYQKLFSNMTLILNPINRGKGYSFMRGYETASGEYFHVLDGDDFFISYDKLQKQVDFLDTHKDYVAIAHNSLILFEDYHVFFVSGNIKSRSYEYMDCIENQFYCHTSAYMYRKIHKKLPETFLQKPMRGDSAVFFYHVFHSKMKVMYYPDIASVYNFHGKGLWSGLSENEKAKLIREVLKAFMDLIIVDSSTIEYSTIKNKLNLLEATTIENQSTQPVKKAIEDIISYCIKNTARIYSFELYEKAFNGMHGLRIVDQLCEAVGRVIIYKKGYLIKDRIYDENKIAILISGLVPNGGGIFNEIRELIKIHLEDGKNIDVFSSNIIKTEMHVIKTYFNHPRIKYWQVNEEDSYTKQIESLIDVIYSAAPAKIYPFITHHDAILNSVIQKGLGKTIILDYVYDHGLSLGISNSSIDKYVLKTESQINALSSTISPNKFIYIPPFLSDLHGRNPYKPYRNYSIVKRILQKLAPNFFAIHSFTTASAAARSYKVESDYEYSYSQIIPNILKTTGGVHYHYGPLSDAFKQELYSAIKLAGVDENNFKHIEWSSEFSKSLLKDGIDVFLSPFPVCSARIAIEVMACGIPLLNHNSATPTLPQAADFCSSNQLSWDNPDDLYETLRNLNAKMLTEKSRDARMFFEKNNEFNVVKNKLLKNEGNYFALGDNPKFVLTDLLETEFYQIDENIFI